MFVQIPEFPMYLIDECGVIVSLIYNNPMNPGCRWRVLGPTPNRQGYLQTHLRKEGRTYARDVHCLVAKVFLGNRPEGMDVNHKDGNKLNNNCDNLEYCTRSQNIQHAYNTGLNKGRRK